MAPGTERVRGAYRIVKTLYWPTVALKSIVIIHIDIIKSSEVVTTSSELCMSSN